MAEFWCPLHGRLGITDVSGDYRFCRKHQCGRRLITGKVRDEIAAAAVVPWKVRAEAAEAKLETMAEELEDERLAAAEAEHAANTGAE